MGPAIILGMLGAVVGFVLLGVPLGICLWLHETRARTRDAVVAATHQVWVAREERRAALAHGVDPVLVAHDLVAIIG
ncbi:hypothetical protein [Branchiibius cervicis]|uniref:Uncharacterized protein n=1 Tax=Branchiibius cervicis TaxID=908252 RepID=A0ABW2AVK2_9MICO